MPQITAYKMSTGVIVHRDCARGYQKLHSLAVRPPYIEIGLGLGDDRLPCMCAYCNEVVLSRKIPVFKSMFDSGSSITAESSKDPMRGAGKL
jgi:hypothetical protein